MPDYYELKGTFMRACEWHQEGNANEGGTSLCSLCRYGADNGSATISWATAGEMGFKGSKKSTPYAAQTAAEKAAKAAVDSPLRSRHR